MNLNPVDLETPSELQPPPTRQTVPRSQSALCRGVFFTLFVVLNLIVINIFDLSCV